MFVLIWATLLFSSAEAAWGREHCVGRYCVTLSERELTAEAGLCVVIPCSFTTADEFTPKHTVWYKCDASQHSCSDADIIFHSNKNTDKKAQSGFEGRVSRLEPDVSQKNCSIIINDLKESDSGSYRIRVNGERNWREDGFASIQRTTVSVEGVFFFFFLLLHLINFCLKYEMILHIYLPLCAVRTKYKALCSTSTCLT